MHKTRRRSGSSPAASTALPLVLALAVAVPFASPASAQEEIPRGATVLDRERPEVDPLGVQLGAFFVFPSVTVEGNYDDNVFATENDRRDDFIVVAAPAVRADSTWSVHDLKLGAGARIGRYSDYTSENFEDYYANAQGRLDITSDSALSANLGFNRLHEGRGSPDTDRAPTQFNLSEAGLRFNQDFNRVSGEVAASVQHYDYRPRAGDDNDDRDITIYRSHVRGDYRFAEEWGVFSRVTGNWREPTQSPDPGERDRTSRGWQVDAGLAFDLTGVTFGEVFAGYRQQYFEDDNLDDVKGLSFGAEVVNNFTRLTTFTLRGTSSIEETTFQNASSYLQHSLAFRADHELRRNILLHGGLGYDMYDYQGIDREADRFTGTLGATWMANRHMHFKANYTHTAHNESGAVQADDWNRNLVMLSLQLHL